MAAGDVYAEVEERLRQLGAEAVRSKKHQVWRLPDGRIFVMASSPSDRKRAGKNALRDLRHMLGEVPSFEAGERRVKRVQPRLARQDFGGSPTLAAMRPSLSQQLAMIQVTAQVEPVQQPALTSLALAGPEGTHVAVGFRLPDDRCWLARLVARLWRK